MKCDQYGNTDEMILYYDTDALLSVGRSQREEDISGIVFCQSDFLHATVAVPLSTTDFPSSPKMIFIKKVSPCSD